MWGFVLLLLVPFAIIAALLTAPMLRRRRRSKLRGQEFPDAWDELLGGRLMLYRALPDAQRRRLQQSLQVFLDEKDFVGCNGLTVTLDMRLAIAAQACLLIMGRDDSDYDALKSILVYPSSFFVEQDHVDAAGVLSQRRRLLAGESWERGQVVLAWDEADPDKADAPDGYNVVMHEFAHQLDQFNGGANGAPQLDSAAAYTRWADALATAYAHQCAGVDSGEVTLLDKYAAESPAEFFAVACEVFFEMPAELAQLYPALYEEFCGFFRLDPRDWYQPGWNKPAGVA